MIWEVASPTRVDLAGGTLDMWPLFAFLGEAYTINVSISIFTRATLEVLQSPSVRIESRDLDRIWQFSNVEEFRKATDPYLKLYHLVEKQHPLASGFSLTTQSESPVGGGLGGSSSLMISLLRAFAQAKGEMKLETLPLMNLAHNLEAKLLRTPTGTQDYIPAIVSGLHVIHYTPDAISLTTSSTLPADFDRRFLLVHTGRAHHSGLNNFEVLKAAVAGDLQVMAALEGIALVSRSLKAVIESAEWHRLDQIFADELKYRLQLTPHFSSPEIEKLISEGAREKKFSVKICGAGGGGCVLLWLRDGHDREGVEAWVSQNGFRPLNAKPVLQG